MNETTRATPVAADADKEQLVESAAINPKAGRLVSLDVFRGLTVAGMIVANNPGSWSTVHAPLLHAAWHGWTPTDLIFPSFLFIVGVSITFALTKRREDPSTSRGVLGKIIRRSLIIFALGIVLTVFPDFTNLDRWRTVRIPGVLQRIALCYLIASLIFLATKARGQIIAFLGLLVGYWAMMKYVPVPEFGAGDWERGRDLTSHVDRLLLSGHIYKKDYDPEGLLSTLPAVATTLMGILAGHWLRSGRDRASTCSGLFVAGFALVILGGIWGAWFPINKALWSSSFVLLAGGWSMLGLAACYWLVDIQGYRRLTSPLKALGINPIAAYTLAVVASKLSGKPAIATGGGRMVGVHEFYYQGYLVPNLPPMDASLAYALNMLLAVLLVVWVMDLLHLHIRA